MIARFANKSMMHPASAESAEASFSCANSASNSFLLVILDAILASIIICGLLGLVFAVLVLGISLLVLVQRNQLALLWNMYTPRVETYA